MRKTKEIGIVILAAGASTRMGKAKQLLKWKGQSLLERAIGVARHSKLGSVMVVFGANREAILPQVAEANFDWVQNDDWATGMGSSVRAGLSALLETHPNLRAVIFVLVDQPLITSNHLLQLARSWQEQHSSIVCARYQESNGVPALFDRHFFPELLALSGETGAKSLFHRHANQVTSIAMPAAALDVDTPEAWASFLKDHSDH